MPDAGGHQGGTGKTIADVTTSIWISLWDFAKKHPVLGSVVLFFVAAAISLFVLWQVPAGQAKINSVISDLLSSEGPRISTKKDKVILLLPTGKGVADSIKQDAERQLLGFFDYLSLHEPEDETFLEIVVRSHGMERAQAEQIVREEMKRGNRYFLVTMSTIAEPLAKKWKTLNNESCPSKDCILIATVSSAPGIADNGTGVYRFYVRSEEEAAALATAALRKIRGKGVAVICVDDAYGHGAADKFKDTWERTGGRITSSVFLPPGISDENLDKEIDRLSTMSPTEREGVFVANYGTGLSSTIRELDERGIHPLLLVTSTFSIKEWRAPVEPILAKFDWISLQPIYRKPGYHDVVRDFTFFSLMHLQETIFIAGKEAKSFDMAWRQAKFPPHLDYTINENGDSVVSLTEFGPEDAALQHAD